MRLLLSPPDDAFTNMALDEALALTADTTPTFRVYHWSTPSISIGYFQKSAEVLNSLACRGTLSAEAGAPTLVRRPTGGTAVIHGNQPSFSLVLRTPARVVQVYCLLGRAVTEALKILGMDARLWDKDRVQSASGGKGSKVQEFSFCTSNFSPYDVVFQGQKVAGYSARRWRGHSRQGSTLFQGYLHLPAPYPIGTGPEPFGDGRLVEALIMGMEKTVKARLEEDRLTEAETLLTGELRQKKYLQQDWNYKR